MRTRFALLALGVAVGVAASGLPLGLLWYAVAPRVPAVLSGYGPVPSQSEPEQFIADDGWYILITLVAGVLTAVAVWTLGRRHRGPLLLLALVVGSVAAGVLTAWLGHEIGLAEYRRTIRGAHVGSPIPWPPTARTARYGLWWGFLPRVQGTALVQAVAATLTYTLLAALHPAGNLDGTAAPDDIAIPGEAAGWPVSSGSTGWPTPSAAPVRPVPGRVGPPPD